MPVRSDLRADEVAVAEEWLIDVNDPGIKTGIVGSAEQHRIESWVKAMLVAVMLQFALPRLPKLHSRHRSPRAAVRAGYIVISEQASADDTIVLCTTMPNEP